MPKKMLGIEIGNCRMKIAVCSDYELERMIIAEVPDNLVRDGVIVSWEAMSDFVRETVRSNNITYKTVALVLPGNLCFVKRVTMPLMTIEQLKFNLPYEFRDYISDEKDKYNYDYAVIKIDEKNGEEAGTETDGESEMELMAAAVLKEDISNYRTMFRRAGLKLVSAAPEYAAFRNIIKDYDEVHNVPDDDFAILDIGHLTCRLNFFTKGEYEATRIIETGGEALTRYIAETLDVEEHIAQIYKETNKDDILESEGCREIYNQIAVEVMRVLNFYNYEHPNNNLEHLVCCGGGALIEPLLDEIGSMIDLEIETIDNLVTDNIGDMSPVINGPQALGIVWE